MSKLYIDIQILMFSLNLVMEVICFCLRFQMRGVQVERVKLIRDFGFVHFVTRGRAEAALEVCKDLVLHGQRLQVHKTFTLSFKNLVSLQSFRMEQILRKTLLKQVCWAKPPPDKHMREEVLRKRERRMWCFQAARGDGCCNQSPLFSIDSMHNTPGYELANSPSCRFAGCTGNRGRGDYQNREQSYSIIEKPFL